MITIINTLITSNNKSTHQLDAHFSNKYRDTNEWKVESSVLVENFSTHSFTI